MQINNTDKIRNFAIIAHIDHGKSTLADRLLEVTHTVSEREKRTRIMDTLELEQERGITIKLQTARMRYIYSGKNEKYFSEEPYILNLIDTPGHVDFSFEVSRSLAASDGAILLVDATQGIQAQTLTTVYKAFEYNLEIIPVVNKIDLPNAETNKIITDLKAVFGFSAEEIFQTSGKTGAGVTDLLNAIIEKVPPARNVQSEVLRALVYDSFYDEHKGVVALVRVFEGEITQHTKLYTIGSKVDIHPIEIGYLNPSMVKSDSIDIGEVGYVATGLKEIRAIHVGDTITTFDQKENNIPPLPGYMAPKPMVYASLYPIDADDFKEFQDALEKLALNDAALTYKRESSQALGTGYLCGFLGLLHLEITQERLEREFDIDLITTSPSVEYKIELTTKDYSKLPNLNIANIRDGFLFIKSAAEYPDNTLIKAIYEPWVKLDILTPEKYIGGIMELAQEMRGIYKSLEYVSDQYIAGQKHVFIHYEIPTAEIITTFFDRLKSISQGYASMDYNFIEYRKSDISKVNIIINYEVVEALSFLTHKSNAEHKGRTAATKLKELIPRQQFQVPIQAAINMKVIARETITAYRKDVTAKLYGGDVTRKIKLLEKQKKGKKKMKMIGRVEIPKEVFLKALRTD
ncbi:MAG: translation elongation factor 4 [bacterium]